MHLFGITFYGIFASGELQSWADPPAPDMPVWSPTKGGYPTAETTFVCVDLFSLCYNTTCHNVLVMAAHYNTLNRAKNWGSNRDFFAAVFLYQFMLEKFSLWAQVSSQLAVQKCKAIIKQLHVKIYQILLDKILIDVCICSLHRMNQLNKQHKLTPMRVQITVQLVMWPIIHLHQVLLQLLKKQYNQKQEICICMEHPMIDLIKRTHRNGHLFISLSNI